MEVTTEAKRKGCATPPTSWMDIPDDVYERILEKLPLSDYVHFGAVCKKWQSIQASHRFLHAPHPPPLPPVPWAMPFSRQEGSKLHGRFKTVLSPFEGHRRTYRLRNPLALPDQTRNLLHVGTGTGWLLLLDIPFRSLYLLNPISRQHIKLPWRLPSLSFMVGFVSPPPHFAISIRNLNMLFLIREEDDDWTLLSPSCTAMAMSPNRTVSCRGNFYSLLNLEGDWNLLVVCSRPTPTFEKLEMDASQLPVHRDVEFNFMGTPFLVESKGEVLLVLGGVKDGKSTMRKFNVFRADLSTKTWVKLESLGDRSLLLTRECCVSVPASDLGNGFENNSILFYSKSAKSWKIFKLGFKEGRDFLDYPFIDTSIFSCSMFVPTLC